MLKRGYDAMQLGAAGIGTAYWLVPGFILLILLLQRKGRYT